MVLIGFRDGRAVANPKEPDVDLRIQGPDRLIDAFESREPLGADLAALTISVPDSNGWWTGHVPPLDEDDEPALLDLPEIPGATVDVQTTLTQTPFGDIHRYRRFRDGRLTAMKLGYLRNPEVVISCSYLDILQLRIGTLSFAEMYERGAVIDGVSLGKMALFLGILDSPEYRAGLEMCCPNLEGLIALTSRLESPLERESHS